MVATAAVTPTCLTNVQSWVCVGGSTSPRVICQAIDPPSLRASTCPRPSRSCVRERDPNEAGPIEVGVNVEVLELEAVDVVGDQGLACPVELRMGVGVVD